MLEGNFQIPSLQYSNGLKLELKVFVSLYYASFLTSLSPFPVVFVEGRRLLLRRLKRPPAVHVWAHDPSETIKETACCHMTSLEGQMFD